jgi:hypothetical protein
MYRILSPCGTLILAIPTMEGLRIRDRLACVVRNIRAYGRIRPPGTKLYTRRSLISLIHREGFRVINAFQLSDPDHPGGFSGLYIRAGKR